MWDPRQYTDTDFGLSEDEEFEPDDQERDIDPSQVSHVHTVLGPVEPGELGVAFAAEHLLYDVDDIPDDDRLDSAAMAVQELTAFVTAGARTIVDIATLHTGRDILGLVDIARRVPAHIVTSTGGDAATVLLEASNGIGPRRIRPGVAVIDPRDDDWIVAAETALAARIPRLFLSRPRAHVLQLLDTDAALDDGTSVDGDAFIVASLQGGPDRLQETAHRVAHLMTDGLGDRVLLAMGWQRRSRWHAWDGQPGLAFGMERLPLALMQAGVGAVDIRRILTDNPARWLAIPPGGPLS